LSDESPEQETRERLGSHELGLEKYCQNGNFVKTFEVIREKGRGLYTVRHIIENKEYLVQTQELPRINGKDELSEIVAGYKGREEGYVTAWIEDTEQGVFLYLQKELDYDDGGYSYATEI
jgi:hypothetical protein